MLSIDALSFSYGRSRILSGLDLDLQPGELVALLGANGSGKSTLMRCLCGIVKPSSGAVMLDHHDVLRASARQRAAWVGYVPQSLSVESPGLSVFEVAAQGAQPPGMHRRASEVRARTMAALEKVGLVPLAMRRIGSLSGGERQRVFIARALALETPYLLLDEPVSALDLKYQVRIMELLVRLAGDGKGVLTIVHDLNLAAQYADRVALLKDGRVLSAGAPGEILTPQTVSEVYGTQVTVAQVHGRTVVLPKRQSDREAVRACPTLQRR